MQTVHPGSYGGAGTNLISDEGVILSLFMETGALRGSTGRQLRIRCAPFIKAVCSLPPSITKLCLTLPSIMRANFQHRLVGVSFAVSCRVLFEMAGVDWSISFLLPTQFSDPAYLSSLLAKLCSTCCSTRGLDFDHILALLPSRCMLCVSCN